MKRFLSLFLVILLFASSAIAQEVTSSTFSSLRFRNIGPAWASGRIADFAVSPNDHSEWYVGVASGGIWKTGNNGTTWRPIFDRYGSYAIGCLAIDPNNTNVVWAGTGENNSQRALGYGDGVYKTEDGGRTWKNMGLKSSRQIGKILIDPRDSDVVYVAAEGSAWGPGGERGLYKTTDGGKTWEAVLTISEHTGVTDMVMDPRNPDLLVVASHQRRRHVFTKINGGPETALHKTTDGGKTWKKLTNGIPGGDKGAIGLTISPVNPDYIYAIIELPNRTGGFFRSTDRGESWNRMSGHVSNSPQYYNEIFCDPKDPDKVFSVETRTYVTEDGGRNWTRLNNNNRHVDDHALWIDPNDTRHFVIGGDGGIYETYDSGQTWLFKGNLPITQFYRVAVDNSYPFYYVYGGTQDNNSMGGPSGSLSYEGVNNEDWFVTQGGDGFWQAVDPENPDIVYSEYQYGGLTRYDRKSGEGIDIVPQPPSGESYRWNWNAPFIISPYSHKRLYFAANKLFRSDDYGNTWQVISPDLTRQIDRNQLEVMGKIWHPEAIAKNASTSLYGTIVMVDESRVKENLVYVGTDDGLIQVTEDAGGTWKKIENFPDVPEFTFVSDIMPSKHDENVVYASFDNRKRDDFKPYILKSTNKGSSWESISNNLPENGTVHTIQQDHINPDLLFVGTEFGFYYSVNGGESWIKHSSGLPTISVRDIAIQEREDDLILATFGRGFYIIDDYSPMRLVNSEILAKEADILPVKDGLIYMQSGGKGNQGTAYYTAPNPPYGAEFTYYLKEAPKTMRQIRKAAESEAEKKGEPIKYPTLDELRAEDQETATYILFTITDEFGNEIRKLRANASAGLRRIRWDFRYPSTQPPGNNSREYASGGGIMTPPGNYKVAMGMVAEGEYTELVPARSFRTVALNNTTLPAADRAALARFHMELAELGRVVWGASSYTNSLRGHMNLLKVAISNTPGAPADLMRRALAIEKNLSGILVKFNGDPTISRRSGDQPPSLGQRISNLVYTQYGSTADATGTMREQFTVISREFEPLLEQLKSLVEIELRSLERDMENAGCPWTPGRIPVWKK
ncbi:glycosyl hydrolase [candidate division KSB1 bacterium]